MKRQWLMLSLATLALNLHGLQADDTAATAPADTLAQADLGATGVDAILPDAGTQEGASAASSGGIPTDSAPTGVGAGSPASLMNFQTDLFTGRFSYRVPIAVAPGRGGSQPNLALGYSSGVPNGWCGVGWTLDMGSIQRETRFGVPVAWNGANPANSYSNAYGFVFTGAGSMARLVKVSGTNPEEYRLEAETGAFMKFLYYPSSPNPYWLVSDKNGNKLYFGQTAATRMKNTKFSASDGSSVFKWALDQAVDANGNLTTLTYTTNSSQLYLSQIKYNQSNNGSFTGNTVDFFCATTRADRMIDLRAGYRVETKLLLTGIVVKANSQNVRRYSLTYTNSPSTGRSQLISVTQYDSTFTAALPALKFTYQTNSFRFNDLTDWATLSSQGQSDQAWNSVRTVDTSNDSQVEFADIDRDGLPDRVMRAVSSPYTNFYCQLNTGSGFVPTSGNYTWGPLYSQGKSVVDWNSVRAVDGGNNSTIVDFLDLNADGYPDRVMEQKDTPYSNFYVQFNIGSGFTIPETLYGPITNEATGSLQEWRAVRDVGGGDTVVDIIDLNGDGLPDRVMRKQSSPYTSFKWQMNTGTGFTALRDWPGVNSQGDTSQTWNSIYSGDGSGNTRAGLYDINGDGLPDRVMRQVGNGPFTKFIVQFNNGAGFEAYEDWGGTLDGQSQGGNGWYSPVGTDGTEVFNTMMDINGDGLIDRVMRNASTPYTNFVVQLNTGSGFTNRVIWGNVSSEVLEQNWRTVTMVNSSGDTKSDLVDINGDGLPDRVMRKASGSFDRFKVQLNAGPFPDLMNGIDNSMGGTVQVTYTNSTTFNNRDENGYSQLAQAMWVASKVVVSDGFDSSANTTNTYTYERGFYDYVNKEFRGFGKVTATDSLNAKTVTYFHQGGGWENSANGEYQDAGSVAKKGVAYRVEAYGASSNTNLYSLTINKVEETQVGTTGSYFARITQTANYAYEGLGGGTSKIALKLFNFDTTTGDLLKESNLGEIVVYNQSTHAYTDSGSDDVYNQYQYSTLANGARKPDSIKTTADSGGGTVLRETRFEYDSLGNPLRVLRWLDTCSCWVTNRVTYDVYGNPLTATDPVNIVTSTSYDSATQTFPETNITGTFTNQSVFDVRSGVLLRAVSPTGLVSSNAYDGFFRLTSSFISTTPNGAATLWRVKASYSLGTAGAGTLYTHMQAYDPNDTANGVESRQYMDGLGRVIQTRVEAEGSNKVRVTDTMYNSRGQAFYTTLPYFENSWNMGLNGGPGSYTGFDPIGRVSFTVSPADSEGVAIGDSGSPVGTNSVAYVDGTTLWVTKTTDPENKLRKAVNDAFGRVTKVIDHNGGTTTFNYNKVSDLTWVQDQLGNTATMTYDSLGRKTAMTDPDMGSWSYTPDAAGRLTQQIDAKNQKLKFYYNDEIGRLSKKELYDSAGSLVTNVTYVYDTNQGDSNYTVYKGQLFKVSDRQGWAKNSYDLRGRVLKTSRYLTVNTTQYDVLSGYDDADRVTNVVYPGGATRLAYRYDNANNLTNVASTCGVTSSNEVFYSSPVFDELGRVIQFKYGNGVTTVVSNYPNSKRLYGIKATPSGASAVQNLSYTYDKVANVKSISDSVYAGSSGNSLSNIGYDNLHRLTGYTWNSTTHSFTYNAIGNILTSSEGPGGTYTYGTKPHAVTGATGKTYAYDACGNMTNRNSWALSYDEENQLTQVIGTNTTTFGYADGGARVWRLANGTRTVWIGGIYEERGGTKLCHVFAGGQRIATFEPSGVFCTWLYQHPFLGRNYDRLVAAVNWPLQEGRTPLTAILIPLLGILCVSVSSRWFSVRGSRCSRRRLGGSGSGIGVSPVAVVAAEESSATQRRQARQWLRYLSRDPIAVSPLRRFAVSFVHVVLIVAFFVSVTPTNVDAATCSPVFWYYHTDNLGTSNVLTDRSGQVVHHYENYAFGKDRSPSPQACAFNVSNRYTGQILDEDTGLYYYNARYYDPEVGRFIQADSIVPSPGDPQTLNRYSYVTNNPLKYTDPTGHQNFFSGLADTFTRPLSGLDGLSGLSPGLLSGLMPITRGTEGYLIGQVMGHKAEGIYNTGMNIALGVGTIVVGVFLCITGVGAWAGGPTIAAGLTIASGALSIASGALSIGATAASLAGEPSLASSLGWASVGVGVAAMASGFMGQVMGDHLQRFGPEAGETPPSGNTTVFGVGTTRAGAQAWANMTGDTVLFGGQGFVKDFLRASMEWLTGRGQMITDMRSYMSQNPGMSYTLAHSEGTILMKAAADGLHGQAIGGSVRLVSSFYSPAAAARAFGGIGMQVNYVPQHFADFALIFATRNPATMVGSAVSSIFTGFHYHGFATY